MKFLKRQNTNIRNIAGAGVIYDVNGQVILDSTNVMLVPKGTESQRPTSPTNGHVRYNTTANELEAYQSGQWRKLRFKEPREIHIDPLGSGNATETVFGVLNTNDPDYPEPASSKNILVLVENVFQIAETNYTLEQSDGTEVSLPGPSAPYPAGWYIKFTSPVPLDKPVTVIHNFDK